MRNFKILITIALVISIFAGCATITKGTKQLVSITSNVDGATLILDGVPIGTTPFTGKMAKNKKILRVEKEGYKTETIALSKNMEGMFWGNIITGGTLGSMTDFASGAAYTYAPATYQVDLKPNTMGSLDFEQQLVVRKFAMIYIDEISQNLAAGQGDYVSALLEFLGDDVEMETIRTALEASEGDQVQFGNAVVSLI